MLFLFFILQQVVVPYTHSVPELDAGVQKSLRKNPEKAEV